MTKGEKKFLTVTGIVFLVGLIVFIIGIIAGGIKQGVNLAKEVGSGAINFASNMAGYDNASEMKEAFDPFQMIDFDLNEIPVEGIEITDYDRFDLADVNTVYVLAKAGDINIAEKDSSKYGLDINGKKLRYFMKEDAVYVTADAIDGTVYLPKNLEGVTLIVSTMAGDIEINTNNKFDELKLNAAAGNVEIASLNADSTAIVLGAGNLELADMNVNNIEVNSIFGNIEMAGSASEKVLITGIGNIELKLYGVEEDYNYSLTAAAGNIKLGSSEWKGTSLNKEIDNSATTDLVVSTKSGNIEISFK